ncbi:ABC transporter permease subunit [Streptomyces sp. TRM43335]|uniref:ABC transporter permease subunit n=1 Tax=Streptomyces taklimakanensis TaxID=2569853 RepID=A0A6G2B8I8_9ACTN|nr:sugar ABC transporter permease [Streptomyces taklimakanensis]MTE18222.1 ABC transporter permease subunit [Streptomyces taklimakanensis]
MRTETPASATAEEERGAEQARRPAPPATPSTAPPPGTARRRARRETLAGYLFLSPWCVGILLLTLGPMLVSLYLAFTDYNLFDSPRWVGLENFSEMFSDDRWWQSVRVTAVFVLVATPLKLAVALGVAMLLARPRKGQGFYRSAFYAPSLIGASVSVGIVWRALFQDEAIVDRSLSLFGWSGGGWIGDPDWSMPTLVALSVWQFGAPMVIFLAGLKQVPRELYEAAEVDGAGAWRRFRSITLPMISPVIFFNLLLEIIHSFQIFTSALVIAGPGGGRAGGPGDSLLVYTWYLYEQGFANLRMGYASAMAWMLLAGIAVVTAVLFWSQRRWVHYEEGGR